MKSIFAVAVALVAAVSANAGECQAVTQPAQVQRVIVQEVVQQPVYVQRVVQVQQVQKVQAVQQVQYVQQVQAFRQGGGRQRLGAGGRDGGLIRLLAVAGGAAGGASIAGPVGAALGAGAGAALGNVLTGR